MANSIATRRGWPLRLLGLLAVLGIAAAAFLSPIPQDPGYHRFADGRRLAGLANFWNVVSNAGFVLVACLGLSRLGERPVVQFRVAYVVFCVAVLAVGAGSAYYHHAPSTATLVWDRLPMAVAFMALFSGIAADRISPRFGRALLWPLVLAGVGSVLYWHWTELQGSGDLRAYGVVQFLPMLLLPVMVATCPGSGASVPWLWLTVGTYLAAKLVEHFDLAVYQAIGIGGHSIKHLLAAVAVWFAVQALSRIEAPWASARLRAGWGA